MSLFTPNTDSFDNYYDKGKFLMLWRASLFFIIIFSILNITIGLTNTKLLLMFSMPLIVGIICTVYLLLTKKFKPIFWLYAISGSLLSNFAMNYVLEASHFVDFLWITICILIAFIGLGKKEGFFFLIVNIIGIAYFFFFSLNDHLATHGQQSNAEIAGIFLETVFAFAILTYLLYQYILFHNYASKQLELANKKLTEQNTMIIARDEEKTTLVKEIHHRVKNNLQIIISLLRLQKEEIKSDETKVQFSEAINRIMVMSLIHQKLYQEKELADIEIKSYLIDLSNDIKTLSNLGIPINIDIESNIKKIGLKTIVPLGLIINELISNSIKHAFTKMEKGNININISETENNQLLISYSDNGTWIVPNEANPTFGLELIGILTEQLEGKHNRESGNEGTKYSFLLSNMDIEK